MAKAQQTATSLPRCASCKREVGKEAGSIPFNVDDCATMAPWEGVKHECFCPTCFVYVRSPREPHRFTPGFYVPVKCTSCGLASVSIGQPGCMQCGSRIVVVMPPMPGVA